MKNLTFFFALMLSVSSFAAGLDTMKLVLDQTEVSDLEAKLAQKGFSLVQVTDKYAENGVRPRCICESFELSFVKYNGANRKIENYSVVTTGFGNKMRVVINKIK